MTDQPIDGGALLDGVEEWFGRFIAVPDDRDLALLTLWTIATHVAVETYTTPRLLIDSTTPGSGKTTCLDHIGRLACSPLHAAALSSPAVLVRSLQGGIRTLLIDEVDRSLSPNKPGVEDLIAILNSGYRRGATRPVLVPVKGGAWEVKEMPTFCPVALAGNSPRLPDDTRSRSIRILLMPDRHGRIEDSDWEFLDEPARELRDRIIAWTDQVRGQITGLSVDLPAGCIGRNKEKWRPLKRVAVIAGSHWPQIADELITRGMAETDAEHDAGLTADPPGMVMLRDLHAVWPGEEPFVATERLVAKLIAHNPEYWGLVSAYGKALTARRLGVLVSQAAKVTSTRLTNTGPRGYAQAALAPIWDRLGIHHPKSSGTSGTSGSSGENRRSRDVEPSQDQRAGSDRHHQSGSGSDQPQTAIDLHVSPVEPDEPSEPVVSDTPTSVPLRIVPDTTKLSCPQWFAGHLEDLIASGVTTVESTEVLDAGEAVGYRRGTVAMAAKSSPLVSVADRRGNATIWRLGEGTTNTYVPAAEWLTDWLAERADWVRPADVYAAAAAAGYSRDAIRGASKASRRIRKRGSSSTVEWAIDTTQESA